MLSLLSYRKMLGLLFLAVFMVSGTSLANSPSVKVSGSANSTRKVAMDKGPPGFDLSAAEKELAEDGDQPLTGPSSLDAGTVAPAPVPTGPEGMPAGVPVQGKTDERVQSMFLVKQGFALHVPGNPEKVKACKDNAKTCEVESWELRFDKNHASNASVRPFFMVIHHIPSAPYEYVGGNSYERDVNGIEIRGITHESYQLTIGEVVKTFTQRWGKMLVVREAGALAATGAGFAAVYYLCNKLATIPESLEELKKLTVLEKLGKLEKAEEIEKLAQLGKLERLRRMKEYLDSKGLLGAVVTNTGKAMSWTGKLWVGAHKGGLFLKFMLVQGVYVDGGSTVFDWLNNLMNGVYMREARESEWLQRVISRSYNKAERNINFDDFNFKELEANKLFHSIVINGIEVTVKEIQAITNLEEKQETVLVPDVKPIDAKSWDQAKQAFENFFNPKKYYVEATWDHK